jgi:hypothetical protein
MSSYSQVGKPIQEAICRINNDTVKLGIGIKQITSNNQLLSIIPRRNLVTSLKSVDPNELIHDIDHFGSGTDGRSLASEAINHGVMKAYDRYINRGTQAVTNPLKKQLSALEARYVSAIKQQQLQDALVLREQILDCKKQLRQVGSHVTPSPLSLQLDNQTGVDPGDPLHSEQDYQRLAQAVEREFTRALNRQSGNIYRDMVDSYQHVQSTLQKVLKDSDKSTTTTYGYCDLPETVKARSVLINKALKTFKKDLAHNNKTHNMINYFHVFKTKHHKPKQF